MNFLYQNQITSPYMWFVQGWILKSLRFRCSQKMPVTTSENESTRRHAGRNQVPESTPRILGERSTRSTPAVQWPELRNSNLTIQLPFIIKHQSPIGVLIRQTENEWEFLLKKEKWASWVSRPAADPDVWVLQVLGTQLLRLWLEARLKLFFPNKKVNWPGVSSKHSVQAWLPRLASNHVIMYLHASWLTGYAFIRRKKRAAFGIPDFIHKAFEKWPSIVYLRMCLVHWP